MVLEILTYILALVVTFGVYNWLMKRIDNEVIGDDKLNNMSELLDAIKRIYNKNVELESQNRKLRKRNDMLQKVVKDQRKTRKHGVWAQIIQFKKDAQRIDDINKKSGDIKNDTNIMKPLVCATDENVRQLKDELLVRRNQIDTAMEGIAGLVKEQQFNEYIRQRISGVVVSPEYIVNAVQIVYERNAELERDNSNLINENKLLQSQNNELQELVKDLRQTEEHQD